MASSTDISPPTDDSGIATEQPKDFRSGPTRLNQALAWVGIVAGGLFVVATIFFSGFFLSWSLHGQRAEHMGPGPMACCSHIKPGEMGQGAMMAPGGPKPPGEMMPGKTMGPGGMMGPGGQMGPAPQSPTTTAPSAPRP
jgi:hypothetical protein